MKTHALKVVTLLSLMGLFLLTAPARADFGSNWSATVYNNTTLSGNPSAIYTGIAGINFNWASGAPVINGSTVPGVGVDNFSIRFSSTQSFADGVYNFVAVADDGIRIFIDGSVVLDKFISGPLTTYNFLHTMSAGQHTIIVEYFENIDQAQVQFQWFLQSSSGNGARGIKGFEPGDNRINREAFASVAIYCYKGGIVVYGINSKGQGYFSFFATRREILAAAKASSPDDNILVDSGDGEFGPITLWFLSSGEFQVHAPGLPPETYKSYDYIFDGC
jgi:hypothetical protein